MKQKPNLQIEWLRAGYRRFRNGEDGLDELRSALVTTAAEGSDRTIREIFENDRLHGRKNYGGGGMTQPSLDFDRAIEARDRGMSVAAANRSNDLRLAREIAVYLARELGEIISDDVRKEWGRRKLGPWLGNAAGSLFAGGDWEWTGEFARSAVVEGHGNLLRVWRLKPFLPSPAREGPRRP